MLYKLPESERVCSGICIKNVDMMHFAVMCIRPLDIKKQGGIFVYNQLINDITNTLPLMPNPESKTDKLINYPDTIEGMIHPNKNFIEAFELSKNVNIYWND